MGSQAFASRNRVASWLRPLRGNPPFGRPSLAQQLESAQNGAAPTGHMSHRVSVLPNPIDF
jgi:hypothetical protein